jgi:GTPase SAR1 family protein
LVGQSQRLIEIVDTARQDELLHTRIPNYPETDLFLICASLTDPSTFDSTSKWMTELKQHCKSLKYVLIGLNTDLRSDDSILLSLAQQNQSPYSQKNNGLNKPEKSKHCSIWNVHHF